MVTKVKFHFEGDDYMELVYKNSVGDLTDLERVVKEMTIEILEAEGVTCRVMVTNRKGSVHKWSGANHKILYGRTSLKRKWHSLGNRAFMVNKWGSMYHCKFNTHLIPGRELIASLIFEEVAHCIVSANGQRKKGKTHTDDAFWLTFSNLWKKHHDTLIEKLKSLNDEADKTFYYS